MREQGSLKGVATHSGNLFVTKIVKICHTVILVSISHISIIMMLIRDDSDDHFMCFEHDDHDS